MSIFGLSYDEALYSVNLFNEISSDLHTYVIETLKRMSLREIEVATGFEDSYASRVRNGKKNMTLEQMVKVAKKLAEYELNKK